MSDDHDEDLSPEQLLALRRSCSRALVWHGSRDAASYLDELPATVLKIDQTFTRQLDRPRTQATVRCILDLAETFDLTVVAEGVETAEQQHLLMDLGCHHAQGFHLLQPLPTDRLAPMITASGLAFDEPRTA